MANHQVQLLDLPEHLLEVILVALPTREAAGSALVCRRLRDLCAPRSKALWAVLRVEPQALASPQAASSWLRWVLAGTAQALSGSAPAFLHSPSLPSFTARRPHCPHIALPPLHTHAHTCARACSLLPLAACRWLLPRAAHVRSIELKGPRLLQPALAPISVVVSTALVAAAPGLEHLRLGWPDWLRLKGWLPRLKALQSMALSAGAIDAWDTLAELTALRSLQMCAGEFAWGYGGSADGRAAAGRPKPCLPPSLTALRISSPRRIALPPGLATLTRLASLELRQASASLQGLPLWWGSAPAAARSR